jgi:hypothetical protein
MGKAAMTDIVARLNAMAKAETQADLMQHILADPGVFTAAINRIHALEAVAGLAGTGPGFAVIKHDLGRLSLAPLGHTTIDPGHVNALSGYPRGG